MTQYSGKIIRKTPVVPSQTSASGVWTTADAAAAVKNNTWPVAGVPNPISRSVRTRSSASAYFNRTPASASNRTTWTWSGWVKRGAISNSTLNILFSAGTDSTAGTGTRIDFGFTDSGGDQFSINADNTSGFNLVTTQLFRDPSAWYHIVVAIDTTQATASNRAKVYVNGNQVTAFSTATYPTQNRQFDVNNTVAHNISRRTLSATYYFDGYLTEVNFIDGQALTPSSFGTTDSITGAWVPMPYTGTYGTNGFYLNFKDTTSTTTLGYDYSGNSNNWTANNISRTAGTTYDSMVDVPTLWMPYNTAGDVGATVRGNYAVLNPLDKTPASTTITASNGNLQVTSTNAGTVAECMASTISIPPNSGKWYWECQFTTENDTVGTPNSGIIDATVQITADCYLGSSAAPASIGFSCDGQIRTPSGNTSYTNPTSSQVVGFAYDSSNGKLWVAVAGTWQNSGDPAAGTGQVATASWYANGAKVANSSNRSLVTVFNFGQRPFSYTPPSGYKSLNTFNLPAPTINNGASYMAATLYTGNNTTGRSITGVGFQPDLVWIKSRAVVHSHIWDDSVRGAGKFITSNTTNAEQTDTNVFTSFNSDGFTVGNDATTNGTSSETYVAWSWKAGGTSSSNTSGSITSTVSVNATAGFSVVTYTGTGANATVGHGLGVAPKMVIVKCRTGTASDNWAVWHSSFAGGSSVIYLNLTNAVSNTATTMWNSTTPTSTVFSIGTADTNRAAGYTYVAYCFAAVAGYSAFGSYTGNGSADGPFVYCGFRPRWVMIKRTDTAGYHWGIWDTSQNTYNLEQLSLYADGSDAQINATDLAFDGLSNGFKIRGTSLGINPSGGTFIYAAFAENPFKYSNAR